METGTEKRVITWGHSPNRAFYPRLQEILDRWEGTPYMDGQRMCGQGVDCVRLVEAILEELFDFEDDFTVERVAQDSACHDERTVTRVMNQLQRRYPHTFDTSDEVQPGDIVIINQGKGPGHCAIVGTRVNIVYHAIPFGSGVAYSGIGYMNHEQVAHTIHVQEKHKWV